MREPATEARLPCATIDRVEDVPGAIRLRPMALHDVATVSAVEDASFSHAWPRTAFERELTRNGIARYVVVECVGEGGVAEVPAFAGLWLQLDEAHVVTVAVRPELRGRGFGRLVLAALLGVAREEGMNVATLEVRESNIAARALYASFGFYEVGARKRYYSDTGEDAVIMTTEEFGSAGFERRLATRTAAVEEAFPGVLARFGAALEARAAMEDGRA